MILAELNRLVAWGADGPVAGFAAAPLDVAGILLVAGFFSFSELGTLGSRIDSSFTVSVLIGSGGGSISLICYSQWFYERAGMTSIRAL